MNKRLRDTPVRDEYAKPKLVSCQHIKWKLNCLPLVVSCAAHFAPIRPRLFVRKGSAVVDALLQGRLPRIFPHTPDGGKSHTVNFATPPVLKIKIPPTGCTVLKIKK